MGRLCKVAVRWPGQVLDYLGQYTHRVALANSRLIDLAEGQVRFRWKDYRHPQRPKVMNFSVGEFIRRFLLHVLPGGFRRIRHFGFLANAKRRVKLALSADYSIFPHLRRLPNPSTIASALPASLADRSISARLAVGTSSKSPCSSARRCRFGPSLVTAHDRRFGHRASFAIGCRTAVRAGRLVPVDQCGGDCPTTADARRGVPVQHADCWRHTAQFDRNGDLSPSPAAPPPATRRNLPDIIPIAHARQARLRSIRLPIGPALHCGDVRDRGTDLNPHAFRRCRSVIPRSCRSLFRHDVARLSGVLLAVWFLALACWWSILCSCSRSGSAQAVAGEIEAMGIVDEAVEDSVGIGRLAEHGGMPQYRNDCQP